MKHALAVSALLAIFAYLANREVFSWPYYYDEADYMFAASLGARANWSDQPAQSLSEFVRVGLRYGTDDFRRSQLSEAVRASSDVNFYRHWHGPLYFYWLACLRPLNLGEPATRSLSYLFPIITALTIYVGSLWIFADCAAALLGSALFLWSYPTVASNEIAPHQLFVFWSIVALLLLMQWRATGRRSFWYGSVMAAACAFTTLEVAVVLMLVLILCAGRILPISKSILLFLLTVGTLWPGAILKLAFLKAYVFMAYLALFRASAWGSTGFFESWKLRLLESPIEWLLLAAGAIVFFRCCDARNRFTLAPPVLFGCLMLVALLRVNSGTPRYLLPFLPALQFASGCVIACAVKRWKPLLRWSAIGVVLVLGFIDTAAQVRAHPVHPAPRLAGVLTAIRAANLDGKTLLAPQNDVPMIHYYCPQVAVSGYINEQERSVLLARSDYDAVLKAGDPVDLWRPSNNSRHYVSQR